jgi:hypothetical protein
VKPARDKRVSDECVVEEIHITLLPNETFLVTRPAGHMTAAALRLMRRVIEKVEAGKELTTPEDHLLSTAKYITYQGE